MRIYNCIKPFAALIFVVTIIAGLSCINIQDSKGDEVLQVSPSSIEIGEFFPGTIHKRLLVTNIGNENIKNIRITASCGCLNVTPRVVEKPIAPQKSFPITVEISNDGSTPVIDQSITIEGLVAGRRTTETISIKGKNVSTIQNLNSDGELNLGKIERKAPGFNSQTIKILCSIHPSVTSLSIEAAVPWLHLKQDNINGFHVTAICTSKAPEGEFSSIARIRYKTIDNSTGEQFLLLKGTLCSQILTIPSSFSFGVVKIGQRAEAIAKLSVRDGLPKLLSLVASSKKIHVSLKRDSTTEATIAITVLGLSRGNFDESITISSNDQILAIIPISAYCSS
ncbi:MAG: hypothetical protein BGO01_13590 [Armatimonadetes bacterium 55-13]|nr:MAG: hypothetical protein BGO01_13590 [Armatimonadetes bacterium 55-13]